MFQRSFTGYIIAILVGSLFIMAGTETIYSGPMGIVTGTGKWVGASLIVLIFAFITLPVGLIARYLSGILPFSPLTVACTVGPIISVLLIPIIQPLVTEQFRHEGILPYVLFHLLAGAAGGYSWYRVEFSCSYFRPAGFE